MNAEDCDTFLRVELLGQASEIPIARLGICGFGRAASNTVVIDDSLASREHAIIRRNATGHCILNDLGSTNGTWLNGRPVQSPTQLKSGDKVQIGRHVLEFVQTMVPVELPDPMAGRTQFFMDKQLVSAVVIDIRGFTKLSADMGEQAIGAMMSDINREAGRVLDAAGVWSTKFIGDAILALWVHPANAIGRRDVVTVLDVISSYQEIFRLAERQHQPPRPLRFGCGYNVGMATIGNIGSSGAADFTAMGEAVNIAFRLETGTKDSGCDILIAQEVFRSLADVRFHPEPMIDVDLKGYAHPTVAYPLNFSGTGPFIEALLSA
ncbi:adenylate cyclase [Novosphingobium hassiacum]|uniref:Adenylate cyclase n=1 Tax=Novosphingobium hassiacum TaxID=173676 RepID=A0A7W6A1M6_9SPHN|nr:adenylate/guanylate cyclase domain-containing protein [Novosphingobium hassiacum]MBB3861615.1 adenylate cyclase [Novosphingobium hassiacum]